MRRGSLCGSLPGRLARSRSLIAEVLLRASFESCRKPRVACSARAHLVADVDLPAAVGTLDRIRTLAVASSSVVLTAVLARM